MNDETKILDINAEAFAGIENVGSEDFRSFEPAEEAQWLVGGSGTFHQTADYPDTGLDHFFDIW